MKLRVGLFQMDVLTGDIEGNRAKVARWMETRFVPDALPTAIVLPELWTTGYCLDRAGDLADPEGAETACFLGELAKKYGVWFVGGSILALTGGHWTNRGQTISSDGTLVRHYDKAHLIRLMEEDKYFVPGREASLFDLAGVKAGSVICYDIRFCEWVRCYALAGVEVLFVSAEWPSSRSLHWNVLLRARAIENQMYVVAVNRVGTSDGTRFDGESTVIDPCGEILFKSDDREDAAFVVVDTARVAEFRSFLTVFEDRVPEIYIPLSSARR
jgi:predicted amidohydrolase